MREFATYLEMSAEDLETRLRLLYLESMKGNKASYELFLELCSVLIKRYLLKLGGKFAEPQSIEDLLQEVLISLHEKKHTYQIEKPLLPWIYAITRHRYIDFYRSKKRKPGMVALEDVEGMLESPASEQVHSMDEVLEFLTPKQKEMLMLIKVEGQSYDEAAKALSMNVSAVKVAVHRIIKGLKGKVNRE